MAFAGFHVDVAALAAIASGWSATWNVFFPPKSHAAIAAVASFNANFGFVDEHSF